MKESKTPEYSVDGKAFNPKIIDSAVKKADQAGRKN